MNPADDIFSEGLNTRELLFTKLKRFAEAMADSECSYGDNCPLFVRTTHGECDSCKARRALGVQE